MTGLDWLLDANPEIRWQTMRDLTDAGAEAIAAERALLSEKGIACMILSRQSADGAWRYDDAPVWRTTLFTMQLLRLTGIDPEAPAVRSAMDRLESGVRWNDVDGFWELRVPETGGNTFFDGEVEPCINGGALAASAYFGRPSERLVKRLLSEQLTDGGWNCEAPPSTCSSFHTTIGVLEGLLAYERATGSKPEVTSARRRAEEYLLQRELYRRLSTGEVVDAKFLEFSFPHSYRYDVLRALDYFRATGEKPDPRAAAAIDLVKAKEQPDGRWLLDASYSQGIGVDLDEAVHAPSRWNTMRALRVLRWYDGAATFGS